ncbi:FG-GAP-like repeat-containing protein [Streptomyces scabiei]|uniref:FG-GAP-like repeat-containing protein n=1 Tax=Streptomyces scabiei TaxID=1930 RepID=UPI0029BBAAF2|nr:FG-GAP-like repeat-containing protein [Streptomyces scabiei]MDX3280315.1 FG-GAP-like repeat-containing protein [Streptomyces scabiei]
MSRAPRATRRRISSVLLSLPLAASVVLTGSGPASAAPASVPAAEDFNGDGYADLVVGAPSATVSGKKQAGYVAVVYGSVNGLSTATKKIVSRSTAGVPGAALARQSFGATFARADLDRDGYGDLVIAGGKEGSVILWGSASGLTGGTGIAYGASPQAGDFDGDGTTDLALFSAQRVSGDDPSGAPAALWKGPIRRDGRPTAVLPLLDRSLWWGWSEEDDSCETGGGCENGPASITGPVVSGEVADVNGDGRDDILQTAYRGDGNWGNRLLLGGGATGFTKQETSEINLGEAIGAGDVNGDGYDDVVSGWGAGKAHITYGSAAGLTPGNTHAFTQDLPGFPGADEEGDHLGSAVSIADVTGDGYADVALGIMGEDVGSVVDAGSVALLHGSAAGLTGTGAQVFHQNTAGVPGVAEENDRFGATTALLDVDGDGHRDLAAASTAENASSGAVWLLRGTGSGLTTKSALAFGPKDLSAPSTNALFGSFLR